MSNANVASTGVVSASNLSLASRILALYEPDAYVFMTTVVSDDTVESAPQRPVSVKLDLGRPGGK